MLSLKQYQRKQSFVAMSEFDVCSENDDKVCFISDLN